jgi:hypothetical protein
MARGWERPKSAARGCRWAGDRVRAHILANSSWVPGCGIGCAMDALGSAGVRSGRAEKEVRGCTGCAQKRRVRGVGEPRTRFGATKTSPRSLRRLFEDHAFLSGRPSYPQPFNVPEHLLAAGRRLAVYPDGRPSKVAGCPISGQPLMVGPMHVPVAHAGAPQHPLTRKV